ncbi:MAG TPA: PadR family transcriptional regulator [Acidimicrobiales bacterium]|nr:PadR family transcriptional regulator [Acidimicrobiales bacterium]
MLEMAILGLLDGQELHGYEIRKRLRDQLGLLFNVSFGSLYPALGRLERAGAVESTADAGISGGVRTVPMTGSLSGERAAMRSRRAASGRGRRGRKVYRITDSGRRLFAELLERDPSSDGDDARSFGLRLAFARYLTPHGRLRLLERRRAQLADDLANARAVTAGGSQGLDPYARLLAEHTTDSTEREISWLDRLIEAERAKGRSVEGEVRQDDLQNDDMDDMQNVIENDMQDMEGATS